MKILVLKTFKYATLRNKSKFSIKIAFSRLEGVLEVARDFAKFHGINIVVPDEEFKDALNTVKLTENESFIRSSEINCLKNWLLDETPTIVFDEQGFYASRELVKKVIEHSAGKTAIWADPDKLIWSFNYDGSTNFLVSPANTVFKHLDTALSSGFDSLKDSIYKNEDPFVYNIVPRDIPPIYARAIKFNPYPYHYYVEPTSRCNARCIMCPFHSPEPEIAKGRLWLGDGGHDMPLHLFKNIIDEIDSIPWTYLPSYRRTQITAQLRGEPTLAPDCREMFKYVKEKGFKLSFSTNGSLLHENHLDEFLINIGMDEIIISIEGENEEYSRIRPNLNYNDILNNLGRIRMLRDNSGRNLPTLYTKRVHTINSTDEADRRYIDKFSKIADWAGIAYENFDDPISESKGYTGYFFDIPNDKRLPCLWSLDVSIIKSDGSVDMCFGASDHLIGNVNSSSLLSILETSPLRKEILKEHSHANFSKVPFCMKCSSWKQHYQKLYSEECYDVQMNPILAYWRKRDIPHTSTSFFKKLYNSLFMK